MAAILRCKVIYGQTQPCVDREIGHRPREKKRTKKLMKIVASAQTLNTGRCMLVPKIARKTEPKEN